MRRYAFIVGKPCLPDPFLIEISRRTRATAQQVAYFEPNVLYCPPAASLTVRCIIEDQFIFKKHRVVVKEAVVAVLMRQGMVWKDPVEFQEEVVKFFVEEKLKASFHQRMITRQRTVLVDRIMSKWDAVHCRRIGEEQHLGVGLLGENIRRSLGELAFVVGTFPLDQSCTL